MSFAAIVELLRVRIGLDLASIGESAGREAIRARMSASRSSSVAHYYEQLSTQSAELDALVEEIVVSETWFFREPAAYALMCERARSLTLSAGEPFRVLSMPCATGEEAYSVVMTLLDASIALEAIDVHAFDVSRRALQGAQRGVYGDNSFRGTASVPSRHFEPSEGKHRVLASVRGRVRFAQGNILDAFLCSSASFHAVFCRNLLIYLDRQARAASFQNLRKWMAPGSLLFVGHAEAALAIEHGMQRVGDASCFAFEIASKPEAPAQRFNAFPPRTEELRKRAAPRAAETAKAVAARVHVAKAAMKEAASRDASSLEELRELANCGDLKSARARCELLLNAQASAAGYCLLGIICQALDDLAAAQASFDRALYLEPRHHESLVHLAFLHERAGRLDLARTLRRRAERSRAGGPA